MNPAERETPADSPGPAHWPAELYRHWYAVAPASLSRKRPHPVTLLDRHLVLAADDRGGWFALEDRCPHRQVPLSRGCLREGQLHCPYHGWRFDHAGRLCGIPGLADGQPLPAIRVPGFAVRQHDGLLWLRPGAHGSDALPALATERDPGERRLVWQGQWRGHVIDAMENFLDALHTHHVHAGWLRGGERVPVEVALRVADGRASVHYHGVSQQGGLLGRLLEPPRQEEIAHFQPAGSTCLHYVYRNGAQVWVSLHFSPVDARNTRVLATLHMHGRWAPAWLVRLVAGPMLARIAGQDAAILALQQDNMDRFGTRRPALVDSDVVRALLQDWWQHGRLPDPARARTLNLRL